MEHGKFFFPTIVEATHFQQQIEPFSKSDGTCCFSVNLGSMLNFSFCLFMTINEKKSKAKFNNTVRVNIFRKIMKL